MKLFTLFALGALLTGSARAQINGIVIVDATYPSPVTLTGAVTAVGSLTFESTLDGAYPLTVAGNLTARGNIGATAPLGNLAVAGQFVFDADSFRSAGSASAAGAVELRRPGMNLTANRWEFAGQTRFAAAGTYTIRATGGDVKITGQLVGPASGSATLRLVVPNGVATIVQGVPSNITVQTLKSDPEPDPIPADATGRLVNLSTRGFVGTGDAVLIVGFVVDAGERTVLVRGVGPSLAGLGIASPVSNPEIEVVDSQHRTVAVNAGWSALSAEKQAELRQTASTVGAFALTESSRDAALVLHLPAGVYSMIVRGRNDTTGIALAEIYEVP